MIKDKSYSSAGSPGKEYPYKQSKRPSTSSAGPFKLGQNPLECYKCEGWGHDWRECLTKGNVDWGRIDGLFLGGGGWIPYPKKVNSKQN